MSKAIGRRCWVVPEGYLPAESHGPAPQMSSHGSVSVLNATDQPANLTITGYFSDREPVGPYQAQVAPRRTSHLQFNNFQEPESIPLATEFSSIIESDVPVVIQYTRLDSRQAENALMTTIAFAAGE